MPAENPCTEKLIEVRSFDLRRASEVELISPPRGYKRIVSSGRRRISHNVSQPIYQLIVKSAIAPATK
jgi:hypothetical protein